MSQDTRKDPRTKVVSLNVRYKSATVDEFIDNHSYDVSRGGVFIKTNTPFASGTLLKFEIRLAADQAVIAGVGRVVWKREPAQAAPERPAGMGVKFIKVDDASRAVIEKVIQKEGAGGAYESEKEGAASAAPPAPTPAPAAATAAAKPVVTPAPTPAAGVAAVAATPAAKPGFSVKKTMMGMGAVGAARPAAKPTPAPAPVAKKEEKGADFFPQTNSEAEMPPPQERTVMKQAAEFLEEALKEAGGSMDEVGAMDKPKAAEPPKEEPKAEEPPKEEPKAEGAAEEADAGSSKQEAKAEEPKAGA
ncbi:MAG TPA: TIGR02266 family protein, partial [Polyangiaceae bacterium]